MVSIIDRSLQTCHLLDVTTSLDGDGERQRVGRNASSQPFVTSEPIFKASDTREYSHGVDKCSSVNLIRNADKR